MGHKGPVLRPRCIGPGRARTQNLFYSKINRDFAEEFVVECGVKTRRSSFSNLV